MPKVKKNFSNTEYERLALNNRINLSDGHARNTLTFNQEKIVKNIYSLFKCCISRSQLDIESEFLTHFFKCADQNFSRKDVDSFLSYSSSCAIKMAAQYCRIKQLTVYLIEPCFDNIRHILETERVSVIAIQEEQLAEETLLSILSENTAVWIVQPNNPTGFCLEKEKFENLINKTSEVGATIIIDFCFRLFSEKLCAWNQYRFLINSKVKFICLEDTGKSWALADIKVGITVCSKDVGILIYKLHDELLLNVSPLHLLLLTEFVKDTILFGKTTTILKAVDINRSCINTLIEKGLLFRDSTSYANVPMELLFFPNYFPSEVFWEELRRYGIDILPASNYFWTNPKRGGHLFRIPLSRPLNEFRIAINTIEKIVKTLGSC